MDTVLATQALKALGDVHDRLHVGVGCVHLAEVGSRLVTAPVLLGLLQTGPERCVPPHYQWWHRLGDLVPQCIRVAEHPGGVPDGCPGLDLGEGDYLSHVVPAVLLGCVPDQLVTVPRVEIHVDVRH